VLLAVLVAVGFGSVKYLAAFRVERAPETVIMGVSPAFRAGADLLARKYSSAGEGRDVRLVEAGGAEGGSLGELLRSGAVDCVLAEPEALWAAGLEAEAAAPVAAFYQADLLSVIFPSARTEVSLSDSRQMVADLRAGRSGQWPGVSLIGLSDRTPDRQLLEVGGVYPTLESVLNGTYPLITEGRVVARQREGGLAGFASGLPGVGRWLEPNREAVDTFLDWLKTEEARATFYGASTEIRLTAVGDVMLGRKTGREIDQYGLDYPFGKVAERLSSADITFCNLEAPLGDTGEPIPGKVIWLRGRPEYIECLKMAGFDIISVCNNHILDYDSPCMLQTLDLLDGAGIAYAGGGRDIHDARTPRIVEAGGIKIGFIGYTEFADSWLFWSYSYRRTFLADEGVPGCNPLEMALVAEDIARAKAMGADLVAVSYHWGWEDILYPAGFQEKNNLEAIARRTIDLGASIVLGHHPHIVQGFEVYQGGVIAYSLGNFVNDQNKPHQKEGSILELQIGQQGVLSARITPVWMEQTAPDFMVGAQKREMMEKIERISAGFRGRQ
jgi:poly-gamma-glutamate synthesis protein (capsule biosynthesis protein)